jgi:hypothetical protein
MKANAEQQPRHFLGDVPAVKRSRVSRRLVS